MARRALSPTCLALVRQVEHAVPPALASIHSHSCRIGLSGGADSLALTAAMAWARDHRKGPLTGINITARVVDHGLHPNSEDISIQAAHQGENLGIPTEIMAVKVRPSGEGIEAAARRARYDALQTEDPSRTHSEPVLILLAHTLNDQAETVLLGLARGSGTRSLAGMPSLRDNIARPFLPVRRQDTEQACRDWGLTWWSDPANDDPVYARSRLRKAMAILEETLGPGLAQGLSRTSELCREDADFLDSVTYATGFSPDLSALPIEQLHGLPPAIRHRVLHSWLRETGGDAVTRDHVLAVDSLVTHWHGQQGISVPGAQIRRDGGDLRRVGGRKHPAD